MRFFKQEMQNVTDLFEDLKRKNSSQSVQEEAGRRLKNIKDEVEKMKTAMEDKDRQIQGSAPLSKSRILRSKLSSVHVQT